MKIKILVLAAGKGKRMGGDIPKVLRPLKGKPMVLYLLDAIKQSKVDDRPVVVVGYGAQLVRDTLGDDFEYVVQTELLGTGYAVRIAEETLGRTHADAVMVLYGDQPFVRAQTIRALAECFEQNRPAIAMVTAVVPDFADWRAPLYDFGRVVRDEAGDILRIVEKKDANSEELAIKEVNPSFFCFDSSWLWSHVSKLTNQNAQGEYYLTDLVGMAVAEGQKIQSIHLEALECIGLNTREHVQAVDELLGSHLAAGDVY